MGIIKRGILGGFSKKVGNVVGSSWKGIAYMKTLPLSVANPKTAGQVAQRSKFSNVSLFASAILTAIIKPLWDRFSQQMSGYNAFVQTNIDLFAAALPSVFANLVISSGKMESTAIDSIVINDGAQDSGITWTDDSGEGLKLAADLSYCVLINETQGTFQGVSDNAVRSAEANFMLMPTDWVLADVCHAYLAFKRADGTIVSDTSYKTLACPA